MIFMFTWRFRAFRPFGPVGELHNLVSDLLWQSAVGRGRAPEDFTGRSVGM